ncbi:MAG: hypothetical protein K5656_10355 [Lachnospiraceae bacterium]|nr:hypothetical protein [Lachnospiraceae bacterium]
MSKLRSFIDNHQPKGLIDKLSNQSPETMLKKLVMLYILVIVVVCIMYMIHKLTLWQVAITLILLALAFMPLLKGN